MKSGFKKNRLALIFLFFGIVCLIPFQAVSGTVDLKFSGNKFTTDISDTPLKTVLNKIKDKKGVAFKGDDEILNGKISVRFNDFSFQDGLKRILRDVDYSFIYNKDGDIVEIVVVGKGMDAGRSSTTRSRSKKGPSSSVPEGLRITRNVTIPGYKEELTPEERKALTVRKNVSPPPGFGEPLSEEAKKHLINEKKVESPPGSEKKNDN